MANRKFTIDGREYSDYELSNEQIVKLIEDGNENKEFLMEKAYERFKYDLCPRGGEALSDRFSKELCKYLAQKGLPSVRQDNNDILVDGFKVASGGEITINNWNYMGYQISVNQDIEAIENICTKPMIKIPKALSDYGITTDEIVEFCKEYWEKE